MVSCRDSVLMSVRTLWSTTPWKLDKQIIHYIIIKSLSERPTTKDPQVCEKQISILILIPALQLHLLLSEAKLGNSESKMLTSAVTIWPEVDVN